jgi:hypothetical protein
MPNQIYKKLPYGNSNFADLIATGYAYVDKTRFIELLENENNRFQFFIRPRKFGKSLFFSMLSNYYDFNRKDNWESLFGHLYVGANSTPQRSSYAVMEFNFSGIDTSGEDGFKISFSHSVQNTVRRFVENYRNTLSNAARLIEAIDEKDPGIDALNIAFSAANAKNIKIFVIIDEYDHFANDLIAMGKLAGDDFYKRMVNANGLVRDFYEKLKIESNGVLHRIFITGISPVMINDLTSGFNIADNLSLEEKYNEMMGFTSAEVKNLMYETGVTSDLIQIDMETYYNGYLFNQDGENRVYNPTMVLYFFNRILNERKPPRQIIDANLKTDYNRLRRLAENQNNRGKLLAIVRDSGVIANIEGRFSIDQMENEKYFTSLLFYMGLLTIGNMVNGRTFLKIPNYSIQTLYWEYIIEWTTNLNKETVLDTDDLSTAISELAYHANPVPYLDYISQNIFKRLSNRDLIKFDEKYIKIMLLATLFLSRLYTPVSGHEVEEGYTDIYLQRHPALPDLKHEWIWEIKYLPTGRKNKIDDCHRNAFAQLQRYRTDPRFAAHDNVHFASLVFVGKDKYDIRKLS